MKSVLIVDFAYAKWYPSLLAELWPNEQDRPAVLVIPNGAAGSTPHEQWVKTYRAGHNGDFIKPFLAEHGIQDAARIGLIGFSAGCWGVGEILRDEKDARLVSFVLALDGMHGGWKAGVPSHRPDNNAVRAPAHWVEFAKKAQTSQVAMIVSYSRILPPYPSTSETAHALMKELGGLNDITVELNQPVDEAYASGSLFVIGSSPVGKPSDGPEAHIYQANDVQQHLWRTFIKAWADGLMLTPDLFGDKAYQKILFLIGVLSFGLWALYKYRTGS